MPIEARPGQPRLIPNFQQFEPVGTGTAGLGSGERRGLLGNPGKQHNPFVESLIGEIHEGTQLPGDEKAKIERINKVYHAFGDLTDIANRNNPVRQPAEVEAWKTRKDDILHVYAALGLLAYRSLDNNSLALLLDHLGAFRKSERRDTGYTGRFMLTPEQNEILGQITTTLGIDHDRQKTQYTFTIVDPFPQDPYIISRFEAPNVVEGK
jgi:hypothetical protein